MRLVLTIAIATVIAATVGPTATAASNKHQLIQLQLKRFYHADGFIKSIGHVAYRTQYSPNPKIRYAWTRTLRRLISVRSDARRKLDSLRAPPLPPHYAAWLCIHRYEGSWTDSGNPFWGGLQFGPSEWTRYGGQYAPTANLATPLEQMWAAEAYWNQSGFYPWPNTARMCGLL